VYLQISNLKAAYGNNSKLVTLFLEDNDIEDVLKEL
jgi:hypothetical protein